MKMTRAESARLEIKGPLGMAIAAALAVACLLAVPAGARAAERCFAGGQDSGRLEFAGAVEGSGFTGNFGEFSVIYCMDGEDPAEGEIEVEVELASADTDNRDRDQTLKGEEFFAVDQYPESRWVSESIEEEDDGDGYAARGELELKGIRADQEIRFTLEPDGEAVIARGEFSMRGAAEVNRQRFDVGTGEFADPEFVRNRVDVSFEVRLVENDRAADEGAANG